MNDNAATEMEVSPESSDEAGNDRGKLWPALVAALCMGIVFDVCVYHGEGPTGWAAFFVVGLISYLAVTLQGRAHRASLGCLCDDGSAGDSNGLARDSLALRHWANFVADVCDEPEWVCSVFVQYRALLFSDDYCGWQPSG